MTSVPGALAQLSTIAIEREQSVWNDRLREYAVLLDGAPVSRLPNGAAVALRVTPGRHTVQVKIDWCTSVRLELDAVAGETITLACGANRSLLLLCLYLTVWKERYLWLRKTGKLAPSTPWK